MNNLLIYFKHRTVKPHVLLSIKDMLHLINEKAESKARVLKYSDNIKLNSTFIIHIKQKPAEP